MLNRLEQFSQNIQQGYTYDSYQVIASRLQTISFEGFEASLENYGLNREAEIEWQNVSLAGNEATCVGKVQFPEGGNDTLTVIMVKELGSWRIYSIASERAGIFIRELIDNRVAEATQSETAEPLNIPAESQLKEMVKQTLQSFNEAIQIEYFGPFYQQISSAWQQQTTPGALLNSFAVFIQNEVQLPAILQSEVNFVQPPEFNEYGLLILNGIATSTEYEYRVFFEAKYVFEAGQWKLFGIDLSHREGT